MEEDLTLDLNQYKFADVDVPLTHEVPRTTLESLLQVKKEFEQKIEAADDRKKARFQRQLKQFDNAIKATKSGKDFNYTELQSLVPPGFAKIPLRDGRPVMVSLAPPDQQAQRVSPQPAKKMVPIETDADDDFLAALENEIGDDYDDDGPLDPEEERFNQQIQAAQKFIPKIDMPNDDMLADQTNAIKKQKLKPKGPPQSIEIPQFPQVEEVQRLPIEVPQPKPKASIQASKAGQLHNKNLQIILERQKLFKEAALKAKQEGNTSVALVYLRHSKGFDSMIAAAEGGLPLDMANLPVPPQMEKTVKKSVGSPKNDQLCKQMESVKMQNDDLNIPINGDRKTVFKHLCDRLREQYEIASSNYKHFTQIGDITNANKFKKIALETVQDLEAMKNAEKLGEQVPLYHYEKRCYQTIDCNSDLLDHEMEIEIVRAINLSLPKDYKVDNMNTFVKFEFPFPPEDFQADKTKTQYGTCNPEFNQTFKVQIQRKQAKFMRMINRKELKLEIYIKGGFLRSDKLLASCGIKLQPLENVSTLHDAYDLMEGRRSTGSKIELKIRIREPLLHKSVQKIEHKWLIIDKFQLTDSVKL